MADDPITTEDKFGNTITEGDVVEFVYGGDRHVAPVKLIDEAHGLPTVIVTATAEIPAGSVALITETETAVEEPSPEAQEAQEPSDTPEPPPSTPGPEDAPSARPSSAHKSAKPKGAK